MTEEEQQDYRDRRRLRMRRHGRRAYIRSIYSLPSLATLGNAICGFSAMYISTLDVATAGEDRWTQGFAEYKFLVAAYFIFMAMVFDALDGRLARFARHTTDFGGQLDSLADVISFGAAPAFLALQVFKVNVDHSISPYITRLIWAIGALYMSCAAMRLARFNVSNEHGEQAHFSFLGLPSPAAGGAVAAFILMQQDIQDHGWKTLSNICIAILPIVVLGCGLLMVSQIRYPHLVNRYLRGKRSLGRLLFVVVIVMALIVAHRYVVGIGHLAYIFWGLSVWGLARWRKQAPRPV